MKKPICASVLTLLIVSGCGRVPTSDPLTTTEAIKNIRALDGKTVRVTGYLGSCGGYDCRLYLDRASYEADQRWFRELMENRKPSGPEVQSFGLGSDDNFDAKAAPFQNQFVIVTGKVMDTCRDWWSGKSTCTDRSPDMKPASITPSKGS